jgi:hypothetical protein
LTGSLETSENIRINFMPVKLEEVKIKNGTHIDPGNWKEGSELVPTSSAKIGGMQFID